MIQAFGFRVNPRIDLPPGRYQVRIGARESGAGEVGTVFYDLEVPDFAKEKLTMSDVLLTAATSKLVMTPLPDKLARRRAAAAGDGAARLRQGRHARALRRDLRQSAAAAGAQDRHHARS